MTTINVQNIIDSIKKTGVKIEKYNNDWPVIIHANEAIAKTSATSAQWMTENKALVDDLLLAGGALYFRGFNLKDTAEFEQFIESFPAQNIDYVGGVAPRGAAQGKTYESTQWPNDLAIELHQEMAYMHRQPNKVCFYCLQAAPVRGETTIGNVKRLNYDNVDPVFVEKLRSKGLAYQRNLRDINTSFNDEDIDRVHRD